MAKRIIVLFGIIAQFVAGHCYAQIDVNANIAYTENFDGMGATTTLPANWRMAASTTSPSWSAASASVTLQASSGNPTTGATYNWGQTAGERAIGAMTSSGFNSPNSIVSWYRNTSVNPLTQLSVTYNAERYRVNTAAASIQFYYSLDGTNWISVTAGDIATSAFPTGASVYSFASPLVVPVSAISISGISVAAGASFYLRWNINTTGSNSQGIGIDDISVTPSFTVLPTNVGAGGVNWVGANQLYTQPTNCDGTSPFVMKYRRVATTNNAPTDGRGQWFTTLNAQASGGDVGLSNMAGGPGNGFLFTNGGACGSAGAWTNKWVFSGVGQAAINGVNNNVYAGAEDMGLNMSAPGYYSFSFKDAGNNNSSFYVGYTSGPPVTILHSTSSQAVLNNDYSISVTASLSATPSSEEKFFLRYSVGANDFSASTSIVEGSVAGTTATFTIPIQPFGTSIYYYIFSSTFDLTGISLLVEGDRSLACLNYADNANANYHFFVTSPQLFTWIGTGTGSWTNAANWNPAGVPINGDGVVFENVAPIVVTQVPNISLHSLAFSNAGTVTWQSSENVQVNVGFIGSSNPVLNLPVAKQFVLDAPTGKSIAVNIRTGFTASISGTISVGGTGVVPHRFLAEDPGAISFESGSTFIAAAGFSGNAFGNTGTANALVFKSGSIYESISGGNPFGLGQPASRVVFQTGSLYKHNQTGFPSFSGRTYADILVTSVAGANLSNLTGSSGYSIDNITLESGVTLGLNLSNNCNIKGNITVATGSTLSFNPSGPTVVKINGNSIQTLSGGGAIVAGGTSNINVVANSSLYCGNMSITGAGLFTVSPGATLGIGSPFGITNSIIGPTGGNIQTSFRSFDPSANYIYNGLTNQVTGDGLPLNLAGNLSIANTGLVNDNLVTLTNNNTIATTLNLYSGLFASGANQTLQIAASGAVNGLGGHVSTNANGEGGTIEFLGSGLVNGTPNLYNVKVTNSAPSGVGFVNNATVYNQLIIASMGYLTNAPRYGPAATLVYRTGGTYARNVEWGNEAIASNPGYPSNVLVEGNTTVDLYTNALLPSLTSLPIAGSLQLGSDNGNGKMYLNNNMPIPLEIKGDLTIGNANLMASFNSELGLEDTQLGGDLILHGSFTRWSNSTFQSYNRAVFLRGNTNSSINVFPTPPATGGTSVDEHFPYLFIQKSDPYNEVTINCSVGIDQQLDLSGNGLITSGGGNVLVIQNKNANAIIGGSATSFVNGPLLRKTAISPQTFSFPIGKKISSSENKYRPVQFTTVNNLGNGDEFTAEYFSGTDITPTPGLDAIFLSTNLNGIMKDEYWQFDRIATSNATGKLALYYQNPGTNKWRDEMGTLLTPCPECNVAVVKRDNNNDSWAFTQDANLFDMDSAIPEAFGPSSSGFLISKELISFSPFTIGFGYNTILSSLPLKLLSFDGKLQSNDAQLNWSIDSDKDLLSFEIQHSTNGVQFANIGSVKPAGNQYRFVHSNLAAGKHYYRLLVKEKAGKFYSKTVALVVGNSGTFITGLQTTVVHQQVVANIYSAASQKVEATITDMSGRIISKQSGQLMHGQNQFMVPVALLAKGVYHITIFTQDGIKQTLRWLKE